MEGRRRGGLRGVGVNESVRRHKCERERYRHEGGSRGVAGFE